MALVSGEGSSGRKEGSHGSLQKALEEKGSPGRERSSGTEEGRPMRDKGRHGRRQKALEERKESWKRRRKPGRGQGSPGSGEGTPERGRKGCKENTGGKSISIKMLFPLGRF